MFILILFFLIVFLFSFPYIKRFYGRFRFVHLLKKECALKRYKLKKLSPFLLYFRNFSNSFDVTVDTGKNFYAFKFWDELHKNINTIVAADGRVYKRKKIVDVFGENGKKTHSVLESKAGKLGLSAPEVPTGRRFKKIILPNSFKYIYTYDGKELRRLQRGDTLCGMIALSKEDVFKLI